MNKFSSPFMAKSPFAMHKGKPHKKVDPDAPGTPGKAGYEPPVVKKELDKKGREMWDNLRIENDSLLSTINPKTNKLWTQKEINAERLKKHLEKK